MNPEVFLRAAERVDLRWEYACVAISTEAQAIGLEYYCEERNLFVDTFNPSPDPDFRSSAFYGPTGDAANRAARIFALLLAYEMALDLAHPNRREYWPLHKGQLIRNGDECLWLGHWFSRCYVLPGERYKGARIGGEWNQMPHRRRVGATKAAQ